MKGISITEPAKETNFVEFRIEAHNIQDAVYIQQGIQILMDEYLSGRNWGAEITSRCAHVDVPPEVIDMINSTLEGKGA